MNQPLILQIRSELSDYLFGNRSLQSFEEWFGRHALTLVALDKVPEAEDLTYEIELRLSEFSHGDWSEDELKDILRPLIMQSAIVMTTEVSPVNGTSSVITRSSLGLPGSLVHIQS